MSGTAPLLHAYPTWEPPEDDPAAPPEESRGVWYGRMHIVGRQRARKLRRRRTPLMSCQDVTSRGRHRHAWFVGVQP
jgi:hypothetical protein